MDQSEKRIIGSLLLLSGLTFLVLGLYTDQLNYVMDLMKEIFETAVAGAP
jgi:hypothetical protein